MDPKLKKLLKAIYSVFLAKIAQLVVEYGVTVGAAGLVSTAVHVPGVLQTGSAAFAVLTAIRYFIVPSQPAQSVPESPKSEGGGLEHLYATLAAAKLAEAAHGETKTGAYL